MTKINFIKRKTDNFKRYIHKAKDVNLLEEVFESLNKSLIFIKNCQEITAKMVNDLNNFENLQLKKDNIHDQA